MISKKQNLFTRIALSSLLITGNYLIVSSPVQASNLFETMQNKGLYNSSSNESEDKYEEKSETITATQHSLAWYKFLDPSLSLSQKLEAAEHKHQISPVPIPLNIYLPAQKDSKQRIHNIILKATNDTEYSSFKTVYGNIFARQNALLMLSLRDRNLRIFNITGYEKDVVFKLPNGQIIAIGPGSEMIIAKALESNDLNNTDNIARRGFTRIMKSNELQMAFAQFSYSSLFELPELKFFQKNQNKEYLDSLSKALASVDDMRGTNGFRKSLTESELIIHKQTKNHNDRNKVIASIDSKITKKEISNSAKIKEPNKDILTSNTLIKAKTNNVSSTKNKIENENLKAKVFSKATDIKVEKKQKQIAKNPNYTNRFTKLEEKESKSRNNISTLNKAASLQKASNGNELEQIEKNISVLRKKIEKNNAFLNGGLLNEEQKLKFKLELKQLTNKIQENEKQLEYLKSAKESNNSPAN